MINIKIILNPIGVIRSPFKTRYSAPFQGTMSEKSSIIEIFDEFIPALKDIETYSHLIILYFAHESSGYHLQIITPWDTNLHGLFTTRSPNRPNSILSCVVELINRNNNKLVVKYLDAIDKSPLIDIKPYLPKFDSKNNVNSGWLEGKFQIS